MELEKEIKQLREANDILKKANTVLFDYIEIYYNRVKKYSANGWLSPETFEQKYFKNLEGSVIHDTA